MLGGILGIFSGIPFPHRFSTRVAVSLLSIPLNAALGGTLAHVYGLARVRAGKRTTNLATFWGGACFALGVSGTRLLVIMFFRNE
jgi:hypothetical protein